jgi:starvation-inducible DNA-binding protein
MHTSIHTLNQLLSEIFILYTKTLKFHWNVRGQNFGPLHAMLNANYLALQNQVDLIAERIRMHGELAPGTCKEFLANATIKENPGVNPSDKEMLKELLADHTTVINALKKAVDQFNKENAQSDVDFATGILQEHEKMAWFIRAHLE